MLTHSSTSGLTTKSIPIPLRHRVLHYKLDSDLTILLSSRLFETLYSVF